VDTRYESLVQMIGDIIESLDVFDSLNFRRCRWCDSPCPLYFAFSNLHFRESSKYYIAWRESELSEGEVERLCHSFKLANNN